MSRRNVQHGQKRPRPWSVIVPCVLLVVLVGLLIWELVAVCEAVA